MSAWLLRGVLAACWAGLPPAGGGARAQPASAALNDGGAYVDRVLDDGPQQSESLAAEDADAGSGWARGWSVEAQAAAQSSGGIGNRTQSLLLSGFVESPDHGVFSLNGTLNRHPVTASGHSLHGGAGPPAAATPFRFLNGNTWRVDQRGMPFDGGWYGNNSVGNIGAPNPPLARGSGQIFLPSLPIDGVALSLEQPGRSQLNVSAGRLGHFGGSAYQGFASNQGMVRSGGGQTQVSGGEGALGLDRTDAALQFIDARNVNPNGVRGRAQNTRAAWTALSWQGLAPWADALGSGFGGLGDRIGGMRLQANLMQSEARPANAFSPAPREAAGGRWLDAAWRSELMQQSASLYHFDPGLRWGSQNLPGDLRGAQWRGDVSTRQWQLGGSAEYSDSVSGLQRPSVWGNLFGRFRFDSRDAMSGSMASRSGPFAARSAQLSWEHASGLGYSQWRAEVANGVGLQVVRAGLDQSWRVGESRLLSTSLAFEQSKQQGQFFTSLLYGVIGSTPIAADAHVELALRGSNGIGGFASSFQSADLRLSWRLGRGLSLITQFTGSHGLEQANRQIVSALSQAQLIAQSPSPNARSVLVALRYEDRAGATLAPIGGSPGSGAGRLEGHVFFDHNANGRREASEGGVPQVTLILDGRFVALTDAQGFYSFPAVAAGMHRIELVQDNLPLPWGSAGAAARQVELTVRGSTVADFAVQRSR